MIELGALAGVLVLGLVVLLVSQRWGLGYVLHRLQCAHCFAVYKLEDGKHRAGLCPRGRELAKAVTS